MSHRFKLSLGSNILCTFRVGRLGLLREHDTKSESGQSRPNFLRAGETKVPNYTKF